jgi:hypothetical protein
VNIKKHYKEMIGERQQRPKMKHSLWDETPRLSFALGGAPHLQTAAIRSMPGRVSACRFASSRD